MTQDAAFIDPDARDLVVVAGPDAQSYLQSQVAQEIRDQAVGERRWTLVLEPAGKVVALAGITRTGDERFELDVDAGYGEVLGERLRRFMIRVQAEIAVEAARNDEPGADYETARVAAGWPRMGFEIEAGSTIPAVTGVTSVAVNFTKGCYPGQELVERMDSRGADAPASLRVVDVDAGAAVGDPVLDGDGVEAGSITSVSPDGRCAIARVKRGHQVGAPPAHLRDER